MSRKITFQKPHMARPAARDRSLFRVAIACTPAPLKNWNSASMWQEEWVEYASVTRTHLWEASLTSPGTPRQVTRCHIFRCKLPETLSFSTPTLPGVSGLRCSTADHLRRQVAQGAQAAFQVEAFAKHQLFGLTTWQCKREAKSYAKICF